jgi:acetate kinase
VLGGLDALVFTAGIGENSAEIRKRICEASAWLGIELDEEANSRCDQEISTRQSKVSVWVIPTNEELMIARHTASLLGLNEHATEPFAHVARSASATEQGKETAL